MNLKNQSQPRNPKKVLPDGETENAGAEMNEPETIDEDEEPEEAIGA